jgi:hypothetical protein
LVRQRQRGLPQSIEGDTHSIGSVERRAYSLKF